MTGTTTSALPAERRSRIASIADRVRARPAFLLDPPEEWETPLSERVAQGLGRGLVGHHPYRPRREADVPAGALASLAEAAGVAGIDQLLVMPSSVRPVAAGRRWRWVTAPTQVLGLGTRAVALWVDEAAASRVRVSVPLDGIAAIEDVRILLYSRLTIFGRDGDLRVRYSTVGRYDLLPALAALREAVAGGPLPLGEPRDSDEISSLPVKWRNVASSPTVLLRDEAAAVLYDEPRSGRRRSRPTLVALTPRELVVARQPARGARTDTYGVDSLHLPRRRIERATSGTRALAIRSLGLDFAPEVGERLAARAREEFAGLLPWA